MADKISASPEQLRVEANNVVTQSTDMQTIIDQLTGRLGGLTDVFTGSAQAEFDNTYQSWSRSARDMMASLEGLGNFLTSAANSIEQLDADLAQGVRGS